MSKPPWITSDHGQLDEVNTTMGFGCHDYIPQSSVDKLHRLVDNGTLVMTPSLKKQLSDIEDRITLGKYVRFMPVAAAYAQMSKYPGTKVGALILGPGFEARSSGWNGAPRKCAADTDHRLKDRATRLVWASHAEANAITNAARSGTPLEGCVMVVTHSPCMSCAKLIVQVGITKVITVKPDPEFTAKWADDFAAAHALFRECGVQLIETDTTER